MVEAFVTYEGGFRCSVIHEPSGNLIQTDAPKDNMGKGETFSPTDLFATSLGVCGITTIAIKMKDAEINFTGTKVRVEKHMTSEPPRKIAKINIEYSFPIGIPEKYKQTIIKIAESCPVALSMSDEVKKVYVYNFPE